MLLLLASLAFADDPKLSNTPKPLPPATWSAAREGEVLTREFLQRTPTGRSYTRAVIDDTCQVTVCTTEWGESYVRPIIPEFRDILDPGPPPGRHIRARFRPDPFDVLPTGHSVDGLLSLVRGVDPHDSTRIGGAPATFFLDGAELMSHSDW